MDSRVKLKQDVSEAEKYKGGESSHTTVGEAAQVGMKWMERGKAEGV